MRSERDKCSYEPRQGLILSVPPPIYRDFNKKEGQVRLSYVTASLVLRYIFLRATSRRSTNTGQIRGNAMQCNVRLI